MGGATGGIANDLDPMSLDEVSALPPVVGGSLPCSTGSVFGKVNSMSSENVHAAANNVEKESVHTLFPFLPAFSGGPFISRATSWTEGGGRPYWLLR